MKKTLSLILLLITLTGCTAKKTVDTDMSRISFDMNITCSGADYSCSVITDGADFEAKVIKPKALSGMNITYSGGVMNAEYLGLSYEIKDMPTESIADVLATLVKVMSQGVSAEKRGDSYVYEGNICNSPYELFISADGLPLSISYPDGDITAEFNNVKVIK